MEMPSHDGIHWAMPTCATTPINRAHTTSSASDAFATPFTLQSPSNSVWTQFVPSQLPFEQSPIVADRPCNDRPIHIGPSMDDSMVRSMISLTRSDLDNAVQQVESLRAI